MVGIQPQARRRDSPKFLGATLSGCGLVGRTVPDGFYGEPNTGLKIRPTDPNGRVRYDKPYWTVEEDGTMVLTAPNGTKMPWLHPDCAHWLLTGELNQP